MIKHLSIIGPTALILAGTLWAALAQLKSDKELYDVKEQARKTTFSIGESKEYLSEDGKFKLEVTLLPDGTNPISLFEVTARTFDGTKIESLSIGGVGLPLMSEVGSSDDFTERSIRYTTTILSQDLKIFITLEKKSRINISVNPFKQEKQ